jgi:hypothetical protein
MSSAKTVSIEVKVKTAWWVPHFIAALKIVHLQTGWRPTEKTVERIVRFVVSAGVRVKVG